MNFLCFAGRGIRGLWFDSNKDSPSTQSGNFSQEQVAASTSFSIDAYSRYVSFIALDA